MCSCFQVSFLHVLFALGDEISEEGGECGSPAAGVQWAEGCRSTLVRALAFPLILPVEERASVQEASLLVAHSLTPPHRQQCACSPCAL